MPKTYASKTPAQRRAHSKKQIVRLANASKGKSVRTPHVVKAVAAARAEFKKKEGDLAYKKATHVPKRKKAHPPEKAVASRREQSAQSSKQLRDRLKQEEATKLVRRKK